MSVLAALLSAASAGGDSIPSISQTVTYDTAGSFTATPPGSWVSYVQVDVRGAGGGGGEGSYADDTGGAGGGGGGRVFTPSSIAWNSSDTMDVVVGAGGQAGQTGFGVDGGDGGNSSVTLTGDTDTMVAQGGTGGDGGANGGLWPGHGVGNDATGIFAGSTEQFGSNGEDGEVLLLSSDGGAGGAGAGSGGAGGVGGIFPGTEAGDGTAPGGGAGGGYQSSTFTSNGVGGTGAVGRVSITWKSEP